MKNIIISVCAIALIGLIFMFQSGTDTSKDIPKGDKHIADATSARSVTIATATTTQEQKPKRKAASGLTIAPGAFHYDIAVGKTPCGDTIGTFDVTSANPDEKLYWELQGMKPLWLNLSPTWGETPAHVDMTYNCILSGASNGPYQAALDVMQTNKDGSKPLHKYLFAVIIDGTIALESK